MKALISTDDYIYRYNGIYYVENSDQADIPMRYLRVFATIRLVARIMDIDELPSKYIRIDHPNIEIWPMPCFKGFLQFISMYMRIQKALHGVADSCCAAVLRMPSNLGFVVWRKVRRAKLPYAVEGVCDAHDGYNNSRGVWKLVWYGIHKHMQKICFQADGVACVTQRYMQQRYYTKKEDGFAANYSSIALPSDFYGVTRTLPQKSQYVLAHASNFIIYNGMKGHVELVKAAKIVREAGYDVHIRFAGKDHEGSVALLEKLAEEMGMTGLIEHVGFLSKGELRQFLLDADIFVMPTQMEGLPRVIIEAMAVGLPCISTDISGNSELLQPEFLVPKYNDISSLAEKIITLLEDSSLYASASQYNFANSRQYEKSVLEKRRDGFYSSLKKIAIK